MRPVGMRLALCGALLGRDAHCGYTAVSEMRPQSPNGVCVCKSGSPRVWAAPHSGFIRASLPRPGPAAPALRPRLCPRPCSPAHFPPCSPGCHEKEKPREQETPAPVLVQFKSGVMTWRVLVVF